MTALNCTTAWNHATFEQIEEDINNKTRDGNQSGEKIRDLLNYYWS